VGVKSAVLCCLVNSCCFPLWCCQLDISAKDIIATLSETVDAYAKKSAAKSTKQPCMECDYEIIFWIRLNCDVMLF